MRVRAGFVENGPGEGPLDAFDTMLDMMERFSGFFIVDLEGLEKGSPDMELLQDCGENFRVIADTGVRNIEDAMDTAMTGVAGVVCDPSMMEDSIEKVAGLLENVYIKTRQPDACMGDRFPLSRIAGIILDGNPGDWSHGLLESMASDVGEVCLLHHTGISLDALPENVCRIVSLGSIGRTEAYGGSSNGAIG